ncbi:MAG: RNase adapter RapZ [Bacteroidales bacterium]|nr:RNase adapter RapZ [Bacteroidales bacterium]
MNEIQINIRKLFEKTFSEKCLKIEQLPLSGSNRVYFRLSGETKTAIGTYNPLREENEAFIHFGFVFKSNNLNVPRILASNLDNHIYLQEDLGNTSVFEHLNTIKSINDKNNEIFRLYKNILKDLLQFQLLGGLHINFQFAYPAPSFNTQSMMWDLNYFKYFFLKICDIDFNEAALEKDFENLTRILSSCKNDFFMYRDFQTRNILIKEDLLYYIDFQGGRLGPLYYDVASLLFSAKANIGNEMRETLLDYYIDMVKENNLTKDEAHFRKEYYSFVLIRILQTLGAYGYRGIIEGKSYFSESIPLALNNLNFILSKLDFLHKLPELNNVLKKIIHMENLKTDRKPNLLIDIRSFSYKRGIPYDASGNGGGFVFDCRGLPNPGRIDELKVFTGNDKQVIEYLEKQNSVNDFIDAAQKIISINIDNYIKRDFSNLCINFGCTGGKHRSVYAANKIKEYLNIKYPLLAIDLKHLEL